MRPLELWAGIECTRNRVAEVYVDQLDRNGHAAREDDLEQFAALGLRTLRYPLLWERIAPDGLATADWTWADRRLARLEALGIRPIVGLVHHGSGPRHAVLTEPAFADGLAEFAHAAARRYPWVRHWTPVNEPLTTARFAGLYGHWYPHGRDDATFVRALLVQCRATALAMTAIRAVIPRARLVQPEDGACVYSTPALRYQAEFENHRRWLSLDALTGRLTPGHPLWEYLRRAGGDERTLTALAAAPCAPDILGLNYYVTSDRFLDERLAAYPAWSHGGNGRERYADVEALRARPAPGFGGHARLLRRAWERYGIPLALTEVHLGGAREAQLRWLAEAWSAAQRARAAGIDVRAVTVWSLLGAYDWNRLLTAQAGFYESGVFDARSGALRATALARMVTALTARQPYRHPVMASSGWWRRADHRVYGPPAPATEHHPATGLAARRAPRPAAPILITGATGTLGRAFARVCQERGLEHRLLRRVDMDIADTGGVAAALDGVRPWAVVNTAGYVRVDDAEADVERCRRENTVGPATLAAACATRDIRLVTFSSDLVFDGEQRRPYVESDPTAPLSVYGRTKADAERAVLRRCPSGLVIRTSAFFGPWDAYNFVVVALRELAAGRAFRAAGDGTVSPTYVPDLVHATLDLLIDDACGLWHLANAGSVTWADFARQAAALAGLDAGLVEGCDTAALSLPARRPPFSALASERGSMLPALSDALARYMTERRPYGERAAA
jgi:dTDP-4-dehydrorhamnose reductase